MSNCGHAAVESEVNATIDLTTKNDRRSALTVVVGRKLF
jgi:hypothetical protein